MINALRTTCANAILPPDAALKSLGESMFRYKVMARAVLLAGAAAAFSSSASAETQEVSVCRDYASAAADAWSADQIQRATENDEAPEGSYVVISYGKRYIVRNELGGEDYKPTPVGARIWERKRVFHEEFLRCLRAG
jgi:hypothetical protein